MSVSRCTTPDRQGAPVSVLAVPPNGSTSSPVIARDNNSFGAKISMPVGTSPVVESRKSVRRRYSVDYFYVYKVTFMSQLGHVGPNALCSFWFEIKDIHGFL